MRRAGACLLALLVASPAAAQAIVVTLSTDEVRIASNFTGAAITVFGAVQVAAIPPPTAPYDIAVRLEGPSAPVVVRRKDPVLGLWINRTEARFAAVPEFYALHTTAPLAELGQPAMLQEAGLGIATIPIVPAAGANNAAASGFRSAMIRLRREAGHYVEDATAVERLGANVFRSTFELPADVPVGTYTATVMVLRDGAVVAEASRPLAITKTGAEQFVYDAAQNSAWLYGLVVILMAAGIGWLGGVVFRRD